MAGTTISSGTGPGMAEGLSKLEGEVRGKAFGFVFAIHNKASNLWDQLTYIYIYMIRA